jgi:hypothetical protein
MFDSAHDEGMGQPLAGDLWCGAFRPPSGCPGTGATRGAGAPAAGRCRRNDAEEDRVTGSPRFRIACRGAFPALPPV